MIKSPVYCYKLLLLSIALILFACTEDTEPDNTIDTSIPFESFDVSYGSDALQDYDIYLPPNRTESNTHVILLIHGGGWTSGDKEDVDGLYDLIKEKMPNYAVANMNYRLDIGTNSPFRVQLEDVDNVIKELDIKSTEYQISDSYALVGVSAGGHMSLQHSYTKNTGDKIKAVGNIIGPTYFLDEAYTMATDPALQALAFSIVTATGVPLTDRAFYEAISPFNVATENAPPTIQFFGDMDPLIPNTQGPLLKAKLDELNVPNKITIYPGEGHGWASPANWDDTFNQFRDFVNLHIED